MDECDQIRRKQIKIKTKSKWNLNSWMKLPYVKSKARTFFRSLDFKHEKISSISSSLNEEESKQEIALNPIPLTTTFAVSRIARVEKINPRELIVHHIAEFNERPTTLNYFQQKYKQLLVKPSLLIPKQYYQEILAKRTISSHSFETKPLPICYDRQSTWTQSVRRLNREYHLTLEAIEQAKRSFENVQYKSIKPTKVTFCLPTISKLPIESKKIYPSIQFTKPVESSSSSLRIQIPDLILPKFDEQEETTFTVETFYENSDSSLDKNPIVVVQENTTEEQFNAVCIPSKISLIPKRIPTMDLTQSKTIPKNYSSTSRIKPPIVYAKLATNNNNLTGENRVKTIVQQINTNASKERKKVTESIYSIKHNRYGQC